MIKGLGRRLRLSREQTSESGNSSHSLNSPYRNRRNRSRNASLDASMSLSLSERSIGGASLEEVHNLKEELKKAQAELKQFMDTKSRAAATTTRTLSASSNVNVHLLMRRFWF
jgi:hypothetical protein